MWRLLGVSALSWGSGQAACTWYETGVGREVPFPSLADVGYLPAVLGGTAGLMVLVSVARPVRQKDPHRRSGPFDTGDDPNAAGALIGRQYLMLVLAALTAIPAATLALLGTLRHQPALQAAGVLAGTATGVLLYWWGGRVATRRLADRGAELLDPVQP
jgi:ABC-2 type transport system permease protein